MFYISMNEGAVSGSHWYWDQTAQNWTHNAANAAMFETRGDADAEAVHADAYGPGEAVVCQTWLNLRSRKTA